MANPPVTCPKCAKNISSKADITNKRIRCPHCSFAFLVKPRAAPDEAKASTPKPAELEDEGRNPYGVGTASLAARCPNCANEMHSETAVICLYCGYNTQTRSLGETKRVYQQSSSDNLKWLMPGIGCLAGIIVLAFFQCYVVLSLNVSFGGSDSAIMKILFSEPIFIWITIIFAGVMWKLGQFAFKRLILEPVPPEETHE